MKSFSSKWFSFVAVAFGPLMATFDSSAVNIALPTIARHFNALLTEVEWVVTGYLLALGLLLLPLGVLGDRWGKKKLFRIGILAFISSSVLCALTQNVYQLILCRVLQGMSGAIFISIAPALLVNAFPSSERGKVMGLMGTCVSLGLMFGAPVGGLLTHYLSWRSIFFVNVPIGILGFFLSEKFLAEDVRSKEILKFDGVLFKNRFFVGGNLSLFFYFVSLFILYFLTPFYLSEVLQFSSQKVGWIMMTFSVAFAFIMPISGWLSDQVGSKILSPLGLGVSAVLYVWIAQLTETSSTKEVIIKLLCLGLASGLFQAPNNSALMGSVSKHHLGMASAFIATMRTFGLMTGVFLATLIFTFRVKVHDGLGRYFSAHDVPAPLFVSGYHDTLLFAAGIIVVSIFFSLLRGQKILCCGLMMVLISLGCKRSSEDISPDVKQLTQQIHETQKKIDRILSRQPKDIPQLDFLTHRLEYLERQKRHIEVDEKIISLNESQKQKFKSLVDEFYETKKNLDQAEAQMDDIYYRLHEALSQTP